jgi:hypothetical protein
MIFDGFFNYISTQFWDSSYQDRAKKRLKRACEAILGNVLPVKLIVNFYFFYN